MRIDHKRRRSHQQSITIGRGARRCFGPDYRARPWAVFDQHRRSLDPANLLREQARHGVGRAARRERNDDLDCFRRLRPCVVARKRNKEESESRNHASRVGRASNVPLDGFLIIEPMRSIGLAPRMSGHRFRTRRCDVHLDCHTEPTLILGEFLIYRSRHRTFTNETKNRLGESDWPAT